MKVNIVGASNFVNRMFEACGQYQWAREFLKNSLEAKAKKITFGIEWQAVERLGKYRRYIADDGAGMTAEELLRFFSTLGDGAKKIGGVHENFGVGAKIASLPWNPEGVVIISYRDGLASMIQMVLDEESGEYQVVEFKDSDGGSKCVIDPREIQWPSDDIDWSLVKPGWIEQHGTVVVLMGSEQYPDTVLGNHEADEQDIKGLSVYLNSRFWDLTDVEVQVEELRSLRKTSWPQSPDDRDNTRRPNRRTILGARYYLTDIPAKEGQLAQSDVLLLDQDRVAAEWYLWEGDRPHIDSYARMQGYIAVRYEGELFHLTTHKAHFRGFGVAEGKVQQNLTIILEPDHFKGNGVRWGVHPDQSRNRLIFTGGGQKGGEVPLTDWGQEFATELPEPILAAIKKARGDFSGSIDDDEYRKRLQEKFGSRWMMRALVERTARSRKESEMGSASSAELVDTAKQTEPNDLVVAEPQEVLPPQPRRRPSKTVRVVHRKLLNDGDEHGVQAEVPVDVPKYRLASKDSFESPWMIASWVPADPEGPTVLINTDSPVVVEAVQHHASMYPDVFTDDVERIVRSVFGEVAVAKVAHSQKLRQHMPDEELNKTYRNEAALTIALMGLLAEESLISVRLGRLGKKKAAHDTTGVLA